MEAEEKSCALRWEVRECPVAKGCLRISPLISNHDSMFSA